MEAKFNRPRFHYICSWNDEYKMTHTSESIHLLIRQGFPAPIFNKHFAVCFKRITNISLASEDP